MSGHPCSRGWSNPSPKCRHSRDAGNTTCGAKRELSSVFTKMVVYDSTAMGICFARSWGYNGCSLRTKHTASIGLKENYFKKMFFQCSTDTFWKKRLHYVYIYIYSVKGKIALQIRVFFGSFLTHRFKKETHFINTVILSNSKNLMSITKNHYTCS